MKPAAYGPFPYSPIIRRPRLVWPNHARVALWIIPNIEFFSLEDKVPVSAGGSGGKTPDVPAWSERDYGNRVGVFRLMQVLSRYDIRGTVALNSNLCARHPVIIEEAQKLRWEWMGHNETNTRRLNEVPAEEEPRIIGDALAENGVEYVCDWVNDDQPYVMTLDGGRRIVSVPYSHDINDKPAFERMHMTAPEFQDMICRQFDTLYREGAESGRVMAIALHPYITGVPHRIGALDAALDYICRHDGVWRTTGAEIARHYLKQAGGGTRWQRMAAVTGAHKIDFL